MKILYTAPLETYGTARMRMEVLEKSGHKIEGIDTDFPWSSVSRISRSIQKRRLKGKSITKINNQIVQYAKKKSFDLFWADKQEYLYPYTLKFLKSKGIKLVHFTPDPYFVLSWKRTPLMEKCMPLYDVLITSKKYELEMYRKKFKKVIYMPLGFCEHVHRPLKPKNSTLSEQFNSDVSSIGGWEARRVRLLDLIAKKTQCNLKIWGYGWDYIRDGKWTPKRWWMLKRNAGKEKFSIQKYPMLSKSYQGGEIYGDDYAMALSGSKIGIGFLRDVCPDQHTTRTFEIPACRSMLLADRTKEHMEFFEEGKEADFFSSETELISKVKYYLKNDKIRKKIAENGRKRCLKSGYSYKERLKKVLKQISKEKLL